MGRFLDVDSRGGLVGWSAPIGDLAKGPWLEPCAGREPRSGESRAGRTRWRGPIVPLGGALAGITAVWGRPPCASHNGARRMARARGHRPQLLSRTIWNSGIGWLPWSLAGAPGVPSRSVRLNRTWLERPSRDGHFLARGSQRVPMPEVQTAPHRRR